MKKNRSSSKEPKELEDIKRRYAEQKTRYKNSDGEKVRQRLLNIFSLMKVI